MTGWTIAARRELIALQSPSGGWPYRRGAGASVEPSALAALALLSHASDAPHEALAAGEWITLSQRPDGGVGLSPEQHEPGWSTSLALLLWSALGIHRARAVAAIRWLESIKGATLQPSDDPEHIVGHDTTLIGWPWVEQTHSWLEPTAMAVLALERWGARDDPRVLAGRALMQDRAIATGGWNYGNKAVFGRPLRPQPGPTGQALLALAGRDREPGPVVKRGIAYLEATIPGLRASISLGWALLGLQAWGVASPFAEKPLLASFRAASGRSDASVKLAMLLLATGPRATELFGRSPSDHEPSLK